MKKIKNNIKGITLVALVITIIVLLILSGITINQLTKTVLFENARKSENEYKNSQEKEGIILGDYENKISEYVDSTRNIYNSNEWVLLKTTTNTNENIIYTLDNEDNFKNYNSVVIIIDTSPGNKDFVNSCIIETNLFKSAGSIQSWCDGYRRGLASYVSDTEFKLWSVNSSCAVWLYGIKQ